MVLTFSQISRTIPAQAGEAGGDFKYKVKDLAALRIRIHLTRIQIRIQHFRLHPDPDLIRIQGFDDQKLKKKFSAKNV